MKTFSIAVICCVMAGCQKLMTEFDSMDFIENKPGEVLEIHIMEGKEKRKVDFKDWYALDKKTTLSIRYKGKGKYAKLYFAEAGSEVMKKTLVFSKDIGDQQGEFTHTFTWPFESLFGHASFEVWDEGVPVSGVFFKVTSKNK